MTSTPSENTSESAFEYLHSESLGALLEQLQLTLFVSTYQAGKLVVVRGRGGRVSTLLRSFRQAMGLAVDARSLVVGTRDQIWFLRNAADIAAQLPPAGTHDACFLPRSSHVTGDVRIHELGWCDGGLWFVNTRFSCLCTLDDNYSFVPQWKPPFVSTYAAEDRCHLNGMEIADGRVCLATALGRTDSAGGWRENKVQGGCLLDVPSGEVIRDGLCMPHSPRLHQDRIWVLDSGKGQLLTIDPRDGVTECVVQLPGYARGLALHDHFAFVGLSKIRETSTFGGLPISQDVSALKCGVWVIDLSTGQPVGVLQFTQGVEEIFDVRVLPGLQFPAVVGFEKDTIRDAFVVPPEALR